VKKAGQELSLNPLPAEHCRDEPTSGPNAGLLRRAPLQHVMTQCPRVGKHE